MLVLLHGALGAAAQLAPLAERLTGAHAPLVPELPGHGATPLGDGPLRVERLAGHLVPQLEAALAARGAERARIFGYSMGGYVALHLAATRPDLVARVTTLGTRLAWTPEGAARETAQLDPAAIRAKVPRFAQLLEARHTALGWEALLAETAGLMRALGDRPLLTAETFAAIPCPVRIAVGDRDVTVTIEESRDAARALPQGELEVLPATPHPFERVPIERLAWSVGEFLGRE